MEDDWDLYAVVRGCSSSSATTITTSAATSSSSSTFTTTSAAVTSTSSTDVFSFSKFQKDQEKNDHFFYFSDPYEPRRGDDHLEELHDLFKPFCPKTQPTSSPQFTILPISQPIQQHQVRPKQFLGGSRSSTATFATSTTTATNTTRHNLQNPRSKRRKNQMKRVCQVPAEGLSSDMWSWRKYGQKPIKGSPYPRGYYRCSTSKGCLARKQVERNRSDPNMFIVTYTGEHNHSIPTHRNSLAGSTRQKPATSETVPDNETTKPTSSTSPAASLSPVTENELVEDKEDDEFGPSDIALSDDFFMGLEEITSPIDHFPFTWTANNAMTTAADGV